MATTQFNRYLGGHDRDVISHPYVKGYFYIYFNFPSVLFTTGNTKAGNYLLSAAEGYTPPSDRQLKMEDIQGQGGVDSSFLAGQTIDRSFSIQYREFFDAPIFQIHKNWTGFFDAYVGGSMLSKSNYDSSEYKGTCTVIQTKPVVRTGSDNNKFTKEDIIKVDMFDGVFPITDLKTAYDANITDNTVVRPNVQYRFDGFPVRHIKGNDNYEEVFNHAIKLLNNNEYSKNSSIADYELLLLNPGTPSAINTQG